MQLLVLEHECLVWGSSNVSLCMRTVLWLL